MEYKVKHGLPDRARVRVVVERAYEAYKERLASHDPTLTWDGDSAAKIGFTIMGKKLITDVAIDDANLNITGKIPFLFRPFEKKILGIVGGEVEKWLEKARAGEI
ncbi:MAG: polyhydroxyalkanoic acid system family protein, partial [Nannocystaceae bacterium]|nr:polyhydroxyalkanoic acid system family protein [Nannocystaceae bacterium]